MIVRALAGDSTMTRLVLPLTTGPFLLAAEERVVAARVLVPRLAVVVLLAVLPVLLAVLVFLVVAIHSFITMRGRPIQPSRRVILYPVCVLGLEHA